MCWYAGYWIYLYKIWITGTTALDTDNKRQTKRKPLLLSLNFTILQYRLYDNQWHQLLVVVYSDQVSPFHKFLTYSKHVSAKEFLEFTNIQYDLGIPILHHYKKLQLWADKYKISLYFISGPDTLSLANLVVFQDDFNVSGMLHKEKFGRLVWCFWLPSFHFMSLVLCSCLNRSMYHVPCKLLKTSLTCSILIFKIKYISAPADLAARNPCKCK